MQRKQLILFIGLGVFVLALSLLFTIIALGPRPLVIGLVGFGNDRASREHEAFLKLFEGYENVRAKGDIKGRTLIVLEFPYFEDYATRMSSPGLGNKRPDIVFTYNCQGIKENSNSFASIPHNLEHRVPPALRTGLVREDRLWALPLLINYLEISTNQIWDSTLGHKAGSSSWFSSLRAILASPELRTKFPLFIAGEEDEVVSLILSALILEQGGISSYASIVQFLQQGKEVSELQNFFPAWNRAIDSLIQWSEEGLLPKDWLEKTKEDQSILLEEGRIIGLIQTLANRREMPYQYVFTMRPAAFPYASSASKDSNYLLIHDIIALLPNFALSAKQSSKRQQERYVELSNFLNWVCSDETLWQLARDSGWAAALQDARQPDIQAKELFLSTLEADSSINGLYFDAFTSTSQAKIGMQEIRNILWQKLAKQ